MKRLLRKIFHHMPSASPIDVFSLVVEDWRRARPCGKPWFFVQIGAHDGKHLDPIHEFVMSYGWTGLLIEPQPAIFEQLKANYADYVPQAGVLGDGLWFLNAAVGLQDGQQTLWAFDPHESLPDHASMLVSSNWKNIARNSYGYMGKISPIEVECISVESLCENYPTQKIDLLQIDTEGTDAQLIKRFLDFGVRPAIIHFESGWKTVEDYAVLEQLEDCGYSMTTVGVNTVCYAKPQKESFRQEQKGVY